MNINILTCCDSDNAYCYWWKKWLGADYIYFDDLFKDLDQLNKYELVMFYIMNTGLTEKIKTIKDKFPKIKIVVQSDSDWWWYSRPFNYKIEPKTIEELTKADLIINTCCDTNELFKNCGLKAELFISSHPRSLHDHDVKPLTFSERKLINRGVIMFHSMAGYDPKPAIAETLKHNLSPFLITTYHSNEECLKVLNKKGSFSEFIHDKKKYIDELNRSLISFDDNYTGLNRFVIECASVGVPPISSKNALSAQLLNPEYMTELGMISDSKEKVEKLINNESIYNEVSQKVIKRTKDYFSEENMEKRLKDNLSKYLNIEL